MLELDLKRNLTLILQNFRHRSSFHYDRANKKTEQFLRFLIDVLEIRGARQGRNTYFIFLEHVLLHGLQRLSTEMQVLRCAAFSCPDALLEFVESEENSL